MILGIIRYFLESTASTSRASICSVTLIVPSSAAIAEIARLVTISPAKTGPSSLVMEIKIVYPIMLSAPNSWKP